ncbi:MAG: hypothetical protein ABIK65_03515 [Candidatus Eisenbacteria bacterium]
MPVRKALLLILSLVLAAPAALGSDLDARFRRAAGEEMDLRFPAGEEGEGGGHGASRVKPFLLSALLPGLGQRENGSVLRSRIFFAAEAVIWTSFIVFKSQEHLRTNDFEEFAEAYAGAEGTGKDFEFYRILTIYDDVDQYNESVRIEARAIYPPSQYPQEVRDQYLAENGFGPDRAFRWRTNEARLDYRLIRNDALNSGRRADYALVAAVVNRALSAVEAARAAGRLHKLAAAASMVRVAASDDGGPAVLRVGVAAPF